jgi:diguanylate cyclase (GGDEF)-like protein/PAS domain S-box-containing protein
MAEPETGVPLSAAVSDEVRRVERREWWLWGCAIFVTLLLTAGLASFLLVPPHEQDPLLSLHFSLAVGGLVATVLLFDAYTFYLQRRIQKVRRGFAQREELFRLISDNAADMIALVDMQGKRLYNSPAYTRILGYSPAELEASKNLEQIHPDDRQRVMQAAEEARRTGLGRSLEYRMRHKDGSWRTFESTASVVMNNGSPDKLVIVNRDVTARKRAEEALAHNAFHDSLTSLPNRALLLDRLQRAVTRGKHHPEYQFAILLIDIDDFKKFNDSFGPAVGDQVLVEISRRLTAVLQRNGALSLESTKNNGDHTLARLGGDDFAILLDEIRDATDMVRAANRIQAAIAQPFSFDRHEVFTTASIGIALSTTPHESAEDMLRDAEIAMYRAKAAGNGRCEVFDMKMHARAVNRLKLESELRRALDRGEMVNHYQPIVSLQNGRIIGFETLARWQHPEKGLVFPDHFIEVADATGLIIAMNRWLMRAACERAWSWSLRYPSDPPLMITANVTSHQFADPNLAKDIATILNETKLPPKCLQLEITETVAMSDGERASRILAQLKELGVGLCIDDFGTGYSSLARLQRFPVDKLKIDRSFVARLHRDPDSREIVRIIITLAHHFGMQVVAEGSETEEHVKYLHELGCEFAQGYFFSKPVDEKGVERLLMAGASRVESESRARVIATPL